MGTLNFNNFMLPQKDKLLKGLLYGILFALAFIFVNLLAPAITIGIPNAVWFSTSGEQFVTVSFLAPVFEEVLFVVMLLWAILWISEQFGAKDNTQWLIALLILVPLFSIFHAVAYAGGLSWQNIQASLGLFVGAALFRVLIIVQIFIGGNVYGAILTHMIINTYLITQSFVVVA